MERANLEGPFGMISRSARILAPSPLLYLCAIFVLVDLDVFAEDLGKQELLSLLASAEEGFSSANVNCYYDIVEMDTNGVLQPTGEKGSFQGDLAFREENWYNLEAGFTINRDAGATEFEHKWMGTFNGEVEMSLKFHRGPDGNFFPDYGTISAEQEDVVYDSVFLGSGLRLTTPLFWGVGLRRYLDMVEEEGYEWSILDQDGVLCTLLVFEYIPGQSNQRTHTVHNRIAIDLSKGCNIAQWARIANYGEADETQIGTMENLTLEQIDGVWVPVSFDVVSISAVMRRSTVLVDWSRINEQLDQAAFVLDFPPNVRVSDEIHGLKFTTGIQLPEGDLILGEVVASMREDQSLPLLAGARLPTESFGSSYSKGKVDILRASLAVIAVMLLLVLFILRRRRVKPPIFGPGLIRV